MGLRKGGVEYREAWRFFRGGCDRFRRPLAVYLDDGAAIGRMVVIGTSIRERILCVVHLERGDRDRIISARRATAGERDVYEAGGRP